MVSERLDDLDRQILHLLQTNARELSDTDIAEETDVTSTTVGNRIEKLEDSGIIRGYRSDIDYEQAGYSLVILFVCTAALAERSDIAGRALEIRGVVNVRETMSSKRNVHVTAVARSTEDVERITEELDGLGLDILRSDILANESVQPCNVFRTDGDEGEVAPAGESDEP